MRSPKPKLSETSLAAPVVQWLIDQHWDVYQEVEFRGHGGVADIVAVRHNILWIIECKTSYSFAVLNQAKTWPAHYRSVAVPWARRESRDYRVAADYYQVGVIEVGLDFSEKVHEELKPKLFIRHKQNRTVKALVSQLTDLHKTYALAGSQSGNHLTPYKNSMLTIRRAIEDNPGCTIKDLYERVGRLHYANMRSFKGNVIKCLESFEKEWCRIDYGSKPYKLYVR